MSKTTAQKRYERRVRARPKKDALAAAERAVVEAAMKFKHASDRADSHRLFATEDALLSACAALAKLRKP